MNSLTKQYSIECSEEFREILMAEFAAVGFDSFQETDSGFIAHSETDLEDSIATEIIKRYKEVASAALKIETVEQENWNKKWEESYSPIVIANKILVRASFHDSDPTLPIEIIINPKMSFGTGHHETTGLMMEAQLDLDHTGKRVLDAGCGTGILTVLAGKLGAKELIAYDNDEWVRDNIQENFKINNTIADVLIGTIESLHFSDDFDIILANINKNILLHDISYYSERLTPAGDLLLSGFYQDDLEDIKDLCAKKGLNYMNSLTRNKWTMARFSK